jgi:hypothetical protein
MRILLSALIVVGLGYFFFEGEDSEVEENLEAIEERLVLEQSGVEVEVIEDSEESLINKVSSLFSSDDDDDDDDGDGDGDEADDAEADDADADDDSDDGEGQETEALAHQNNDYNEEAESNAKNSEIEYQRLKEERIEVTKLKEIREFKDPKIEQYSLQHFNPEFLESLLPERGPNDGEVDEQWLQQAATNHASDIYKDMLKVKTTLIQNENILRALQNIEGGAETQEIEDLLRENEEEFQKLKDKMNSLFSEGESGE